MSLGIKPSVIFWLYPQPIYAFTHKKKGVEAQRINRQLEIFFGKRWDPYTPSQTRFSNSLDYNRSKVSATLTQIGFVHYPSVTLTRSYFTTWVGIPRGFLWTRNCVVTFGLAIAGFSLHLLRGFIFQISDSWFQISDSRFRICGGLGLASRPRRFQISGFRF